MIIGAQHIYRQWAAPNNFQLKDSTLTNRIHIKIEGILSLFGSMFWKNSTISVLDLKHSLNWQPYGMSQKVFKSGQNTLKILVLVYDDNYQLLKAVWNVKNGIKADPS
jgi:hypothetical protein